MLNNHLPIKQADPNPRACLFSLAKICIHTSIRIFHSEFLLDVKCPRLERCQFFVGLFFPSFALFTWEYTMVLALHS